jgi:hypothetical protein
MHGKLIGGGSNRSIAASAIGRLRHPQSGDCDTRNRAIATPAIERLRRTQSGDCDARNRTRREKGVIHDERQ